MPAINTFSRVLITGASSGIGEEFAVQLARRRINLIIHGRNIKRLEAVKNKLINYGVEVEYYSSDISKEQGIKKLIKFLEQNDYNIDFLINNAGFGYYGDFLATSCETYSQMIETNIKALTLLTHHFAEKFVKNGKGGIINVSSVAGFLPIPHFSVYAATKAFVYSFSMALWAELKKHNVHVLCLLPGTTKTRFFERINKTDVKGMPVEKVVKAALKAFEREKPYVIPGFLNKLFVKAQSLIPKEYLTKLVQKYF